MRGVDFLARRGCRRVTLMNIHDYQRKAFRTARIDWNHAAKQHIPTLGVIGELGSIASELKKALRDGKAYIDGRANLMEEFGDLLWYIAALASRYNVPLAPARINTRRTGGSFRFDHIYTMLASFTPLVALASGLGASASTVQRRELKRLLSRALVVTLLAIKREGLDVDKVLKRNLRKVTGVFGDDVVKPARCFDARFPGYERLPRSVSVQFMERARGPKRVEIVLRAHDFNVGDRLTDNAHRDDGYRYHDAFHLAYAAVLGWSPVVRSTFRCKRKSDPHFDEVQDGARAAIVEESIAQTVFNFARGHSWLKGLDRLDHGILNLIQRMVQGLEVKRCAIHEWQRAIFVGFDAFRALKANHGGWLILDAETRSLTYSKEGPVIG